MGEETVTGTSRSTVVDPHEIYEVIITPRNNVSHARDGGSIAVRGSFITEGFRSSVYVRFSLPCCLEQFCSVENHLPLLSTNPSTKFEVHVYVKL